MLFKTNVNNAAKTIIQLADCLRVRISKQTIIKELEFHPNNATLLSISDVLSQFNIQNTSFSNVSIDQLQQASYPLIAHTTRENEFVVVKEVKNAIVYLYDSTISIKEFEKIFNGIILIITNTEKAGDENFRENSQAELLDALRNPVFIWGALAILVVSLIIHSAGFKLINWADIAIVCCKGIGVVISILLLIQSINANNPLIRKICENDTNKNCNAILSSNSSKVFAWLTWSEVGFFYFSGSFLAYIFNINNGAIIAFLSILNILCLPYTFYSIYYQGVIAKQWCVLCCGIQATLWMEFLFLRLRTSNLFAMLDIYSIADLAICFGAPLIFWAWMKPFLQESQKIPLLKKQLNKFKYNAELFDTLLKNQAKYVMPNEEWCIVLGSEDPETVITLASNPYCGPCIGAHKEIEKLISSKPHIQVRIVFVFGSASLETDERMLVARHFLQLYNSGDEKGIIRKAFNSWYDTRRKGLDDLLNKYPVESDFDVKEKLQQHKDWIKLSDITGTPTIIVDGYKLPYPYHVGDLKYL